MGQLETALAELAREPEVSREQRERSRELHHAAQRLAFEDAAGTLAARTVLHREGALSALRALTGLPSATPPAELASAAAARPGLLTDAQAAVLFQGLPAPDTVSLSALHLELLEDAELLSRRVEALRLRQLQRGGAGALLVALLVVLSGWGFSALAKPRDLARGKAWRTSSIGLECRPKEHKCGNTRTDILFHTNNEQEPWFEIDLAGPETFSSLTIRNRMDMGVARATPMVVEVTDDRQVWREVARRLEPFSIWAPTFPATTARYVRLRVLKKTWFHLEAVEVHP